MHIQSANMHAYYFVFLNTSLHWLSTTYLKKHILRLSWQPIQFCKYVAYSFKIIFGAEMCSKIQNNKHAYLYFRYAFMPLVQLTKSWSRTWAADMRVQKGGGCYGDSFFCHFNLILSSIFLLCLIYSLTSRCWGKA